MNMDDDRIDGEDVSRALDARETPEPAGDAEDYVLNDIGLALRVWSEVT
jgi:hypothetical protein